MIKVRDILDEIGADTFYEFRGDDQQGTPEGGDAVPMGYGGMLGSRTYESVTAENGTHVEIPGTVWGDYCGSAINRANCEALVELYPDTFVTVYGTYSTEFLVLPLDGEISDDLADVLRGLTDYPVVSDEAISELEMRLSDEAWELYGASDFRHELTVWGGDELVADLTDDDLRGIWHQACEDTGHWPYAETATDVVLWPNDDFIDAAGTLLVAQWAEPKHSVHPDQTLIEF